MSDKRRGIFLFSKYPSKGSSAEEIIMEKIKTANISRTIKNKTANTPIKSAQRIVLGEISMIILLLSAIMQSLWLNNTIFLRDLQIVYYS